MSDEQQPSPIAELIDAIAAGNFNQSEKIFKQAIADRMHHALEAEKVNVASQIFNGLDDDLGDLDEIDLEDEEELAVMEEGVQLDENFKKAAAALEKLIKDPKFARAYKEDIPDIEDHVRLLKTNDYKASGRSAKNLDTIIRDIVSDAVHKNSSKEASKMWHDAAGLERMKESVEIDEAMDDIPTGIKIHYTNAKGQKSNMIVFSAQDAKRQQDAIKKQGGKVTGHQLMYGKKEGPMRKVEATGVAPQALDKHNCATHVYSEEWGEGMPIHSQHADPDENGLIEWYNVQFDHGIEEKVLTADMVILGEMSHGSHKKKK